MTHLVSSISTAAEALVLAANVESFATCALRPSVVIGPGEYQFSPSLYACISKSETPFIIGDGLSMLDVTSGFPAQYLTTVARDADDK